ncbi:DUF971 domain-containing protein [Aquincola sp. S2]|uniref:DUF971 domain-containing protein n=2 Tax=Pseudaquabacterium terrae TaxID=2732868 RepID=A0ABX2ETB6_9BURK|nr:DUF971 domain-containing protein [Aquabacterium terrae]NRF71985.1 DUF971 domain-containing protein [Aquabacterium terrae]
MLHARSGALALGWADLGEQLLSGPRLRAACRCAGCEQGRRHGQPPQPDAAVRLERIDPVGEFGLQLHFSDGHERGLFPWAYLRELALETGNGIERTFVDK